MLTKNDMARVIVQALYLQPTLPAADDFRVLRMAKTKKDRLASYHNQAVHILMAH